MIPEDQFGALINAWSEVIRVDRARQGLPPLKSPDHGLLIGQEDEFRQLDAPLIVIVPVGIGEPRHEQPMPRPTEAAMRAGINPKMLAAINLEFEAHCWGDPWPGTPKPIFWDFNTALELWRELYMAMYRTVSGPTVRPGVGRWEQPTNMARQGRLLIQSFSIHAMLTDAPLVSVPLEGAEINTVPDAGTIQVPPS